jgi:hypothetical protein
MHIPEQHRGLRLAGWEAGHDVIASGSHRLPNRFNADGLEPPKQIVGHLPLEVLRASQRASHRVDAGPADEVGKNGGYVWHLVTVAVPRPHRKKEPRKSPEGSRRAGPQTV